MQLSEQLFQLVKSLNKAEKGYFRKQVFNSGGNTQKYMVMFNALDKMDAYTEDGLKNLMGKDNTKGNLTNTKRYLLDLLTESLQQYNYKDLPIMQVNRLLQAVEVLIKKKLFELCHDHLDRAEKIALKYDLLTSQLTILNWRYRLAIREGDYGPLQQIEEQTYNKDVKQLLTDINDKWELLSVHGKLIAMSVHRGAGLSEEVKRVVGPLFEKYPIFQHQQTDIFSHKLLIHSSYSVYYRMIGDWDKAFEHGCQSVDLFRAYPEQIEMSPRNYMSVTVNLANRCIVTGRFDRLLVQIGYLKDLLEQPIAKKNNDLSFELRSYLFEHELLYMHFTEQYHLVDDLSTTILEFIDLHSSSIKKENLAIYYYYLGYGMYMNGSFDKGYQLLKTLLDDHKDIARVDLMICAQLVMFLMHYEMGNEHILPHQIKAINYYTKSRNTELDVLKVVLTYFKALSKKDNAKLRVASEQVIDAWNNMKDYVHDSTIIESVDLPGWIAKHQPN